MKQFEITKNEGGQRFDKYLHKRLPEAGSGFLYKMLRKKNITLNGKKATGAEKLCEGDRVDIFFSDETYEKFQGQHKSLGRIVEAFRGKLPKDRVFPVLYEDDDILIFHKPAGMLSQKARSEDISANEWLLQYLLESGSVSEEGLDTFRPAVCNRLDRNTSGILIAGKTLRGLQEMSRQLKERRMKKFYRCIAAGTVLEKRHEKAWLVKDQDKNKVQVLKEAASNGLPIEMEYVPIRQYNGFTMLEVRLITGRSHQIRAHLAALGHPILGDGKYGEEKINQWLKSRVGLRHQLLHAYRVVLEDGLEVIAELPEEFQKVEAVLLKA